MTTYKGLTIDDIIECFTDPSNNLDSQLLNIFLYTYRNYCDSQNIIDLINKRLIFLNDKLKSNESNPKENEGFTKAVICLLNNWLTLPFAFDFCDFPNFSSINYLLLKIRTWPKTISFIQKSPPLTESFKRLEEKIKDVLNIFSTLNEDEKIGYRELPVDCEFVGYRELPVDCNIKEQLPSSYLFKENQFQCTFLYLPSQIIANGLTFIDQQVLIHLKLQEMLSHIRKKPAPSVTAVINKYNDLYNIVIITVKEPSLARKRFDQFQRSGRRSPVLNENNQPPDSNMSNKKSDQKFQVIEKWIQILQLLSDLRNYSSLMAIITALDNPETIKIMNKSPKIYNQYQSLVKANEPHINQNEEHIKNQSDGGGSSNSVNSSKSKSKLKNIKAQMFEIPYLGTYLKNLTYIDDGFSDYLNPSTNVYNGNDERLVNLDKCRRQFDVLVQVQMCISAIKNNKIISDESFLKWYSEIQKECRKEKISLSTSVSSLVSSRSDNSTDSTVSSSSINNSYESQKRIGHPKNKFRSDLTDDLSRKRSQSTPSKYIQSMPKNDEQKICKVAIVKLKDMRISEGPMNYFSRPSGQAQHLNVNKKPETISNGTLHSRERKPIINITRSSSVSKDENGVPNLEHILYKKIQIYEKEHTSNFAERVFQKFGMPNLDPSSFDIVQILANNKEILIPENANVFYALAEQPQYIIEIIPKKSK